MPSHPCETCLEIRRFKSFALAAQRPFLSPVRTVNGMLVLVSGDVNGETVRTPDPALCYAAWGDTLDGCRRGADGPVAQGLTVLDASACEITGCEFCNWP